MCTYMCIDTDQAAPYLMVREGTGQEGRGVEGQRPRVVGLALVPVELCKIFIFWLVK